MKMKQRIARSELLRRIAIMIAEELFTNGEGQKADRLVLELPNNGDGGGWCFDAAVDRIEDILEKTQ